MGRVASRHARETRKCNPSTAVFAECLSPAAFRICDRPGQNLPHRPSCTVPVLCRADRTSINIGSGTGMPEIRKNRSRKTDPGNRRLRKKDPVLSDGRPIRKAEPECRRRPVRRRISASAAGPQGHIFAKTASTKPSPAEGFHRGRYSFFRSPPHPFGAGPPFWRLRGRPKPGPHFSRNPARIFQSHPAVSRSASERSSRQSFRNE